MLDQLRSGWRSFKYARLWISSVERYAFPRIGKMPVSEVTSADVIGILAPSGTRRRSPPRSWASASARSWNGRWRWISDPTTHATGSARCLAPRGISCGTCGRCRTARSRLRSGTCVELGVGRETGLRVPGLDGHAVRKGAESAVTEIDLEERVWPPRPSARKGTASTGSRSAVVQWRSSRRRVCSVAAARSCFRTGVESR